MSVSMRVLAAATLLFAVGCGGPVVRGKVSDEAGSQSQQGLTSGFAGSGGSGTVSAAKKVELVAHAAGGGVTVVSTANVQADGRYTIDLPQNHERLVVRALSANNTVLAQAIVEVGKPKGVDPVVAPPMDTETSLEAAVLAELAVQGLAGADVNSIDLRARINQRLAAEVKAHGNPTAQIRALAEAIAAAQRSQVRRYAELGVTVTQKDLFDAQLKAAQELNVALDARAAGASADQAYQAFYAGLEAAVEARGAKAQERAEAESAASVSFRATITARGGGTRDRVVDAAIRAAAVLEARATSAAVEATLRAAEAPAHVISAAGAAGASLRAAVAAANTEGQAATAFADFKTRVSNNADVGSTVFGSFLGVTQGNSAAASAAVNASLTAAGRLDTSLELAYQGLGNLLVVVNFNLLATETSSAFTTFRAGVRAQEATLTVYGAARAAAAVQVLVVVQGSFRLD